MLSTIVVPNRNAWRHCRAQAALAGTQGVKLFTIDQLAARLAGGFLQPVDGDHLAAAVAEAIKLPLGELDAIKVLPGFQRAAASSLSKAWSAGLRLADETASAKDQAARTRLEAVTCLEQEVLGRLPKSELRPHDLVTTALSRIGYAKSLFGSIAIHGRTEMSPVWRPLLTALAIETEVTWVADARRVPPWAVFDRRAGPDQGRRAAHGPLHLLRQPTARNPGGDPLGQAPPRPGRRSSPDRHRDGLARKLG